MPVIWPLFTAVLILFWAFTTLFLAFVSIFILLSPVGALFGVEKKKTETFKVTATKDDVNRIKKLIRAEGVEVDGD